MAAIRARMAEREAARMVIGAESHTRIAERLGDELDAAQRSLAPSNVNMQRALSNRTDAHADMHAERARPGQDASEPRSHA